MEIVIGSDHGGYELKKYIIENLIKDGIIVINVGTDSEDSVDYPEYALKVTNIVKEKSILGIVICGTGIGISIAANKVKGIRASLCHTEFEAEMTRRHNNSNILALGGRVLGKDLAYNIVKKYINTEFEGGRHQRRIDKIINIENAN